MFILVSYQLVLHQYRDKMTYFQISFVVLYFLTVEAVEKPIYQYRYETKDMMKTDASSIPVRGYHLIQGGYYPENQFGGYSGDFDVGRFRGLDKDFVDSGHYISRPGDIGEFGGRYHAPIGGFGPYIGQGIYPAHHYNQGGEYVDKQIYNEEGKKLNDDSFLKAGGKKGEEISHGKEGYAQGKVALKDSKGDSGYYSEEEAGKKNVEDGKSYHGDQHHSQEGKNGEANNQKATHKKGHVIKGFKTSHHKDENGKTEEFYDEAHDEGGSKNFGEKSGSYGEKTGTAYKGGHDDGHFKAIQNKKEGNYDSKHIVDNSNADHGQYGEKKYSEKGETFGTHNGIDQHSILGHQEANRVFKHHPYHVPFFSSFKKNHQKS